MKRLKHYDITTVIDGETRILIRALPKRKNGKALPDTPKHRASKLKNARLTIPRDFAIKLVPVLYKEN